MTNKEDGDARGESMTVIELKDVLNELPDNMNIHVIFNGIIDEHPDYNAVDNILYIEGVGRNESEASK